MQASAGHDRPDDEDGWTVRYGQTWLSMQFCAADDIWFCCSAITGERLPHVAMFPHLMARQLAGDAKAYSLLERLVSGVKDDEGDPYLAKMAKLRSAGISCASSMSRYDHQAFVGVQRVAAKFKECLRCRRAGKNVTVTSGTPLQHAQQPQTQRGKPAAAAAKQPNTQYLAYNVEHTLASYPSRYHPLREQLGCSTRDATAVLQPVQDMQQLDDRVLAGVSILVREHPELCSKLERHPCGKYILSSTAMQTVPQNGRAWQLVRHGCVTASSCHIFLGFHEKVATNIGVPASRRQHSALESAVQQLYRSPSSADVTVQNLYHVWGHTHEANAVETFLLHFGEAHVFQQSFQVLRALPAELAAHFSMQNLPLIGASPDGLVQLASGSSDGDQACLLECKTKAPFYQDADKRWHWTRKTQPDASVSAEHYSQVQMQLLVTGKANAYLVSWACSSANIFKITINFEWLQAALELLSSIQAKFLSKREVPPESFYKEKSAANLRKLTQEALTKIEQPVQAQAVVNTTADKRML